MTWGSKIVGIAAMGGIKTGDTVDITISRADMRVTKAGSVTTNIYSVLPALGESTGSGTVSPSGQLNFHLISKVTSAKGLNKVGVNLLTSLNSSSASKKPSNAKGIPIKYYGHGGESGHYGRCEQRDERQCYGDQEQDGWRVQ